jgi:hypothetical protein
VNANDTYVLARIGRSPESGASAVDIAKAALGPRARRHTIHSLGLIGLSIAARLCGQGLVEPTRSNRFKLSRPGSPVGRQGAA